MYLQKYYSTEWFNEIWLPNIKPEGSFFEVLYNFKDIVGIVKIKLKNKGRMLEDPPAFFELEHIFDPVSPVQFSWGDWLWKDSLTFKPIKKDQLPLYINMRATEQGRKILESL